MRGWVLVPVLLLTACNREKTVEAENASVGEVMNQVREAGSSGSARFEPGAWEAKLTLENVSAPGVPPQMVDMMRKSIAERGATTTCLTKEQADKPAADFFTGKQSEECRYDHFRMRGGKIDAKLTCQQQGATQVMSMQGDYSPTSYQMRMAAETKVAEAGGPGNMTVTMRVDARRTGECQGGGKTQG